MPITRRQMLAAAPVAAAFMATDLVHAQPSDSDSVIVNGISAMRIVQNSADDYSLKMLSGDGSKDVTFVRYKGVTAYADTFRVFTVLKGVTELMGLET